MKHVIMTIIALTLPMAAQAKPTNYSLDDAAAARIAGRPDIALTILEDIERQRPLDPQVKFQKGVALAQTGKCAAAARTFNRGRALTDHPSFNRATEDAMNDLCPKLARLETSVFGELSIQSNANGGSETDTINVNGATFHLSDDALARKETRLRLGGKISYNAPVGHMHYVVPHFGFEAIIKEEDPSLSLRPEVGLSYRYRGDRSDFRVGPTLGATFDDGDHVSTSLGLTGSGSFIINKEAALFYGASYKKKDFAESSAVEDVRSASLSYIRQFDKGRKALKLSLSYQDTDATNYMNDLSVATISASLTGSIRQKYGYEIYASFSGVEGDHEDPFFGVRRSDNITTVGANLSLPVAESFFGRPYIGVQHTESVSSFETKTYSNTGLTFGFTRSF